jgi:hypothetical protein
MWIWLAMVDLKAHVLHGKSFHVLTGPVVIPIVAAIAAITAAAFFLNAVFAFAIARQGPPEIRAGFAEARAHLSVVLGSGAFVGLLLGLSTVVVTRWGSPWFALSLSVVIGVMMVCYVAVPSSLVGVKAVRSRRDKLAASAVSGALGALGAAVSARAYLLGRIGILMLGSQVLFHPGRPRPRARVRASGRRDGRGEGGQDERPPHRRWRRCKRHRRPERPTTGPSPVVPSWSLARSPPARAAPRVSRQSVRERECARRSIRSRRPHRLWGPPAWAGLGLRHRSDAAG